MKYLLLFLFIAVSCTSPQTEIKNDAKYFDIISFTERLIKNQSSSSLVILKKMDVNGEMEEIIKNETDSLFWATELFIVLSADINKPSLKDAYLVQENVTEANSNLKKTIYTALPNVNTNVKKIEIKYLSHPNEIRQLLVILETSNPVYSTKQRTEVWINNYNGQLKIDSLTTIGSNKTVLLDSMKYASTIIVK